LTRIGERLLACLDPDGPEPADEPEQTRELRVRTGSDGTVSLTGWLDPEGGARGLEVLNSLNGRRPAVDGVPDLRSTARRNADLPSRGGQRPHLVLTMKLAELIDGLGSAVLDTGGRLSAAEARRLACDACIVPMVLGNDSMPLDVGRQQRLATAAIRDALAQRDQGCAFPGCDRPPRYCHAHHIKSWLDGDKASQFVPAVRTAPCHRAPSRMAYPARRTRISRIYSTKYSGSHQNATSRSAPAVARNCCRLFW
jgi:hypothetical protein